MIYLDNAATTFYKPKSVIDTTHQALTKYSANPGRGGHALAISASERILGVRTKAAAFFGSERAEQVCFTANCTAAINTILYGVLKSGDHVIISSLEHNAVLRPLSYLAKTRGIKFDIAAVNPENTALIVAEIKKLIKPETRLIFMTHASSVLGCSLPIKDIGSLCADNNILFAVDAAQSAGHLKIDMVDFNIDYLAIAPHKGLYAPMSTGVLIARKYIDDPLIKGGTGVNSKSDIQPEDMPERIESGSLSVANIVGIGAGIDFISGKRYKEMQKNERFLISFLHKKLGNFGARLYLSNRENAVSVLSFNLPDRNSEEVAAYLSSKNIAVRAGLHCAPLAHKTIGTEDSGTVRVSTSVFNKPDDIEKVLFYLKKF